MICKYCLTKIDDDSVFCESCGSRVQEIGNNDETQLLPKVEPQSDEVPKPVVPSRSAVFAANGGRAPEQEPAAKTGEAAEERIKKKDVRVNDISKLLAEIYDDEEEQAPDVTEETASGTEPDPVTTEPPETVWVSPDIQMPAVPPETAPLFCMACGRKLPEGAAFCDVCGTATGAVEPAEIRRRKTKNSVVLPILKGYMGKPAEMLEKAVSEDAFSLGAGGLLIKDLLIAVIAALCMGQFTTVLEGSWIISGDAFGFAAKVFLMMLLADMILLALVFGASVIFKARGTFKEVVAVCGTGYLLPGVLWLITLVMAAFVPASGVCFVLISLAVTALYIGKAIEAVSKIDKNRAMYMVMAVMVIYIALMYGGLTWIIA